MKKKLMSMLLALSVVATGVGGASAVYGADELFSDSTAPFTDGETPEPENFDAADEAAEEPVLFGEGVQEEIPELEMEEGLDAAGTLISSDSNTSIVTATQIGVNTVYTDNLKDRYDVNWYKFTLTEAGYVSLDFNHPYIDSDYLRWYVQLLDENQKEFSGLSFKAKITTYKSMNIGLAAGTYYVKMPADYNYYSSESYDFRINFTPSASWETELNDNSLSADSIKVNTVRYGSLHRSSDEDWYQFEIPKTGYVSLDFAHEYLETSSSWDISLLNDKREIMANMQSRRDSTKLTSGITGLKPGKYFLRIEVAYSSYSSKDYSFKINYSASDVWETEFNESYSTANTLKVNEYRYGTKRDNRDDYDWFKFTIPKDGYISLSMVHTYLEDSSRFADVTCYRSDMQELISYGIGWRNSSFTGGNIGVPAGTYYVKVRPYSTFTPYKFKVNYHASSVWETEFNDAYTDADSLKLNVSRHGNLRKSSDVDWYKFSLSSKRPVYLNFRHSYAEFYYNAWNVYVYNKGMKEIASFSVMENEVSTVKQLGTLAAGTYYVKITSTWDYIASDYTINAGTHNHTYKTAITKATTAKNGKIVKKCSCGDVLSTSTIYYPKEITLGATSFTYNGKVRTPSVTVMGANGKKISASNYDLIYSKGRKEPGKYAVVVKFKGNYSGSVKKYFKIM